MSLSTTNMSLSKAQDSDNAETYLVTSLGASLDTLDAHRHRGGTSGLLIDTLSASQANGDLFYATGANALSRLGIGGNGTFLTSNGTAPSWSNTIATGGLTVSGGGLTITGNSTITGTLGSLTGLTIASGTFQHNGSAVGFYGTTAISKPTVAGSRGSNAALQSLLVNLANMGLVTDSSS